MKAAVFTGSEELGNLTKVVDIARPQISAGQILVKSVAFAANPVDWKIHVRGLGGGENYITGSDVSGVVEEVGSEVSGFEKGDFISSMLRGSSVKDRGAFSEYVVTYPETSIKYNKESFDQEPLPAGKTPSNNINSFESAASVTLGLGTAITALHHVLQIRPDKDQGKSILIWGGATATGIIAIQIAKRVYGMKVITTASSKHHAFLKSLGADLAFDYHDKKIINNLSQIDIPFAFDTVCTKQTWQSVYDSTAKSLEPVITNILFLKDSDLQLDNSRTVRIISSSVYLLMNGIEQGNVPHIGYTASPEMVKDFKEFWNNILPGFLPHLKHADLKVLGPGLESVNEALDLLRENKVSGEKLVFRFK